MTLKVWGNGFNHIGPTGFQIVKDTSGVIPPGPAANPNPPDGTRGSSVRYGPELDCRSRCRFQECLLRHGSIAGRELNSRAIKPQPLLIRATLANGTYYWRIDEVNADGTTPGPVWSFAVGPPAKAFRPMPWNGMTAVATDVGSLRWVEGESATAVSMMFTSEPIPLRTAGEFQGNQTAPLLIRAPSVPGRPITGVSTR